MGETMNTIYDKPLIYLFIHFALGVVSAWYNWIIYAMVIYQVVQLILGKRFFLFEWEFCETYFRQINRIFHRICDWNSSPF
jgi:uncharacterized membrane protein